MADKPALPVPRVSVVTPMYNASRTIEDTVQSVLAQTLTDFEYILVNDGSTDDSLAKVRALAAQDPRIVVVDLPRNMGNPRATNAGFALARGTFIALMDADDLCHPARLAKQVAHLDAHPDIGLVATQYRKIDVNGRVLRTTRNNLRDTALRFFLLFGVPICNPTKMFRRALLAHLAPDFYNPALVAAADFEFLTRLAAHTRMDVLPDVLFDYRVNPNGLSKRKRDTLIAETLALALPRIAAAYPSLAGNMGEVETFIRLFHARAEPLTPALLRSFVTGLRALRKAYCAGLSAPERRAVACFAAELEVKTLLFGFKLYKRPMMLLRWALLHLKPI